MVATIGPAGAIYTPVIDISEHQGAVDFNVMRARGVDGLILRTNHGMTVDARCRSYYTAAITAGFQPKNIGFYTFVNPKRGSPLACARAFVDTVHSITGTDANLLMLDVENYKEESPNRGTIWPSALFAPWLNEHVDHIRTLAPEATVIAYSNASFWNVWVQDGQLAGELEWIVPRYPIYSTGGYLLHPVPPVPGWAGWAFARAPIGPLPPAGVGWQGWQFSAGYNAQGPVYGCSSADLDLNIVNQAAWLRWTDADVIPPPPIGEPVTPYVFKLADGSIGIRHESGARHVNSGELEGPLNGERVWPVPALSAWEDWIKRELAQYERELDATPAPPGGPLPVSGFVGTIALTATE
jgi:hypothetical protein